MLDKAVRGIQEFGNLDQLFRLKQEQEEEKKKTLKNHSIGSLGDPDPVFRAATSPIGLSTVSYWSISICK